jgi:hypothetical protein
MLLLRQRFELNSSVSREATPDEAVRRKPPGELTILNRTACAVPLQ